MLLELISHYAIDSEVFISKLYLNLGLHWRSKI